MANENEKGKTYEVELDDITNGAIIVNYINQFITVIIYIALSFPILTTAYFLCDLKFDPEHYSYVLVIVSCFVINFLLKKFVNIYLGYMALYMAIAVIAVTHPGLLSRNWTIAVVGGFLYSLWSLRVYNQMGEFIAKDMDKNGIKERK
jgi:ascorbate-specific PTS system EIIC-type component UlaA